MIDWHISNFVAVVAASGLACGVYTKSAAVVVEYKMEHGGQPRAGGYRGAGQGDNGDIIIYTLLFIS